MSDNSENKKPGRKRSKTERPYAEIGTQVEKARKKAGLSLEVLASKIPISNQALSKIESGQTNPNHSRTRWTMIKLAQELNSDFGLEWLREAQGVAEADDEGEVAIIKYYRSMSPEMRQLAVELVKRLERGEILETGPYSTKKAGKKKASKKGRK